MTNLRKALTLLLACAALTALPLAAQTPPDCSFTFNFTGASTQTAVSNLSNNTPCVNWRLTLSTTGTLSATVTFYTSPDNITFTAVPNTVCSSTVQPPCVLQGANPIVGTQGMLYSSSYGSYVRVVVTLPSGAGTGTVRAYGAKGASANAGGSPTGGGGSVTNIATTGPITGGPITGAGTIGLDTTKVAQKFFGTAAPGSVATNLPGDLFTDTTAHNEYVCNAPSGTAAPACTSVAAAGWLLLNGVPYIGATGNVNLGANSLYVGDGTSALPSMAFASDPSAGFYKMNAVAISAGTGSPYINAFSAFEVNSGLNALITTVMNLRGTIGVYGWAPAGNATTAADTGLSRSAAGRVYVGNGTAGDVSGQLFASAFGSGGTFPTITGCGTISATAGGATAGTFTTNTTGVCAAVIPLPTALNGWTCYAQDTTQHVVANILIQSASATNSCTVTGTTIANDVIKFMAIGW